MRWTRGSRSADIEDRRGQPGGGGFGGRIPMGRGGMGLGGVVLLLLLSLVFGRDFLGLSGVVQDAPGPRTPAPQPGQPPRDERVEFVSFVLDDLQDTWTRIFERSGRQYQRARLVLFTDATRSGCGFAEATSGPFYCPADGKVYIDLGFYRELRERFGAPGDFAQAYVLAHEIGHHVQQQIGVAGRVRDLQERRPRQAAALSVRLELQADCLAGVWAHSTQRRSLLEDGDVEEALGAAAAIGDDRMQRQSGGRVNPETWTHGSSRQRVEWFRRGLETGSVEQCDTFRTALP
jgi:predicted metalloprotease